MTPPLSLSRVRLRRLLKQGHLTQLGFGASADVFGWDEKTVVRLRRYNPLNSEKGQKTASPALLKKLEAEQTLFENMSALKEANPTLKVPRLIAHEIFDRPLALPNATYLAFQVLEKIPGLTATLYLRERGNARLFASSLASELARFHQASRTIENREALSDARPFDQSRTHRWLTTLPTLPIPDADKVLALTLRDDIAPLYARAAESRSEVLHGDLTYDNIQVCPKGAVKGLFDALPHIAPVETDFSRLCGQKTVLDATVTAYEAETKIALDRDLINLVGASLALYQGRTRKPPKLKTAVKCLERLGASALPNRAYYRKEAARLAQYAPPERAIA